MRFTELALRPSVVVLPIVVAFAHPPVNAQQSARENGDVNGDSHINITDPIYLLNYLFSGGPSPVPLRAD